jgi:hypothetical protein
MTILLKLVHLNLPEHQAAFVWGQTGPRSGSAGEFNLIPSVRAITPAAGWKGVYPSLLGQLRATRDDLLAR